MASETIQLLRKAIHLNKKEIKELKIECNAEIRKAKREAAAEALLEYKKMMEAFVDKIILQSSVKPKKIMVAEATRPPVQKTDPKPAEKKLE